MGAWDTKFCRGIHRGITLTILSAQGGGLGPLLSPLIVLFCSLFPGGVRILVKSTWQDRIAWKFFFRLTPNSPCFRQLKRFTAQKGALQHSRVKNNMSYMICPLLWTIFGFKRFFSSVFDGMFSGMFTKDIYLAAILCFYFSDSTSFVRNILD